MYRTISLALFGTEDLHFYMRVLTAFCLIENQQLYDTSSPSFKFHDTCVFTPVFRCVLNDALTDGSYAELVHIFALSHALQKPIQSFCVEGTHGLSGLHPYSLRICGTEYSSESPSATNGDIAIMWTARIVPPGSRFPPKPNHIVLLVPRNQSTGILMDPNHEHATSLAV